MTQTQIAVAVATQNHRPPKPPNCPDPFWQLMQCCWQVCLCLCLCFLCPCLCLCVCVQHRPHERLRLIQGR
jgi:hypothetical protein